jgi:hypothetical protein
MSFLFLSKRELTGNFFRALPLPAAAPGQTSEKKKWIQIGKVDCCGG